nr:dTDP-4-dehydrorhamnose reductase [Paenibacillus xylanexedens]
MIIKKVAILGSTGQLGNDLMQELLSDENIRVIEVNRNLLNMDYPLEINERLSKLGEIDFLINCTAFHDLTMCEEDPTKSFVVNNFSVIELAKYCHENGVVFIHFSTDYIFDGSKRSPYTEEDSANPLNVYGLSKWTGEEMVKKSMENYYIFRVSSLFGHLGSKAKGGNFIERIVGMAKNDIPLTIFSDQVMSPTYTKDVAKVIQKIIKKNITKFGVYHCSNKGTCSWYEFAKYVFKKTGIAAELKEGSILNQSNFKLIRPVYSALDISKLEGIYPMPHWEYALDEYLSHKGMFKEERISKELS